MRTCFCILFLSAVLLQSCNDAESKKSKEILPTPQQVAWASAEIGVIIHFDIDLYAPDTYRYGDSTTLPPLSALHPSDLNTAQWIKAAKSAGAKYAVFVAKHGTGYVCLRNLGRR